MRYWHDSDRRARRSLAGRGGASGLAAAACVLLLPALAAGQVTGIDIESRSDLLDGREFGLAGAYEKLAGTVRFALDPDDPANRAIVDLSRAARNADGRVEFSADLYILKPRDPNRGNGTLLFDVVNRGSKTVLGVFNRGTRAADPATEGDIGDGFLMERGFTLVWVGWQFDVVPGGGRMRIEAPEATDVGEPLEGPVRYWFRTNAPSRVQALDGPARGAVPYRPVDPGAEANRLTVREGNLDEPRTIARDAWSFSRLDGDSPAPDDGSIYVEDGFEPGMLYELSYETRGSSVAGLAFAAVRDAVAHLRYDTGLAGGIERTIAFGNSQSGRFLRGFLYEGFNADTGGRIVFDGVIANVAAAVRSGFNRRFAQPSVVEPARFPFSDVEQTDPLTGRTDGLLNRARAAGVEPKLFLVNSSNEYWTEWKAAAMVHTAIDGRADLEPGDNVRVYMMAGTQHGAGRIPPSGGGGALHPGNPNDYRWALRALLAAMDAWQRDGTPPPPSRVPRLDDGSLVAYDDLGFPSLDGFRIPPEVIGTYRFDDGGRFDQGIVDRVPPLRGEPYPVWVPQVDADGNEIAGIRLPVVAVPLATFTGWNLRHPDTGAPTQLARLTGAYRPFPGTRAEREAAGDPRPSIEERYTSRAHYIGLVTEAALELVEAAYLLESDVPAVVEQAAAHWDYVHR